MDAVRDWMQRKDKQIDGITVTNAEWVIRRYFGASVYNKVLTDPENFYLVLEPSVTAQLAIGKQDMSDGSIFAATTYGWGYLEMIFINKKIRIK